jgi:hypothetical protein
MPLVAALAVIAPAQASDWFPHPKDAEWVWEWTESVYSPTPTKEKVTVKEQSGTSFTLQWTTGDLGNPPEAVASVVFQETSTGLFVADWNSTAPPAKFPVLCAQVAGCGNSLASAFYQLIWGSRAPLLVDPLLKGTTWTATGGAGNDVASQTTYLGHERISVPAFPQPVVAAKVRSEITQAGALGDPYGSGVRTVWWVYGVGPVKIVFEHAGGASAPISTAVLVSTNQAPKAAPSDVNYFPLVKGAKARYSWKNPKYFEKPVVSEFVVDDVVNGSARFSAKSISGPMKMAAAYGFTLRREGLTALWTTTRAATTAKLPELGPRSLPKAQRRKFFTPFDLMTFGFNPVVTATPYPGETWKAATRGRDWQVYGVTGTSRVLGIQTVRAGGKTYRALTVRTTLKQAGFPFGSGVRTMWFAPNKGLVKLVFRHGDKSVSTVERIG